MAKGIAVSTGWAAHSNTGFVISTGLLRHREKLGRYLSFWIAQMKCIATG